MGITAVSGNVSVEQAAVNAQRVVELLDRKDIWVAKGLANPLIRDSIRATDFHGKDGLGDSNLPLPELSAHKNSALDVIPETVSSFKRKELAIIATGPLTNIAAVLTKEHDLAGRIGELVVMGGAFGLTNCGYGNETPAAEFNIYSDPEAAKIVFESGVPLKAVGLDVTMFPEAQLTKKDYAKVNAGQTRVSRFASRILSKTMRKWGRFALHDPLAVAASVRPSLFQFERCNALVETKGEHTTGMTLVDRRDWLPTSQRKGRDIMVSKSVRFQSFKTLFLNRLLKS